MAIETWTSEEEAARCEQWRPHYVETLLSRAKDPEEKSIAGFIKRIMRTADQRSIDPRFADIHSQLCVREKALEEECKRQHELLQLEALLKVAAILRPDLILEIQSEIKRTAAR